MQTGSINTTVLREDPSQATNEALRNLDIDEFLRLMITELQNQDPLDPMENDKILSQLGEMRQIGATSRLTDTLDAVLLGQTLSSSTNLIGKKILALADTGELIRGVVEKVTVVGGEPKLHLGHYTVRLKNIQEVLPTPA